jgi:hypothetical protein
MIVVLFLVRHQNEQESGQCGPNTELQFVFLCCSGVREDDVLLRRLKCEGGTASGSPRLSISNRQSLSSSRQM